MLKKSLTLCLFFNLIPLLLLLPYCMPGTTIPIDVSLFFFTMKKLIFWFIHMYLFIKNIYLPEQRTLALVSLVQEHKESIIKVWLSFQHGIVINSVDMPLLLCPVIKITQEKILHLTSTYVQAKIKVFTFYTVVLCGSCFCCLQLQK